MVLKNKFLSNIKGDIFGGITAGVIALPLALAFGVASGLGAAAGLYGAIFVGFFASVFGGTKTQISGPTGPMTVVLASMLATYPDALPLIFFAIILSGLFQIALGISNLGQLIKFVPYPVISGFMSGIGVIIILLQINPLFGLASKGTPITSITSFFQNLNSLNIHSFLLGLMSLLIVFFTPSKIKKVVPPPLIALVLVTIISVFTSPDSVKTIGAIPMGFPPMHFPSISLESIIKIIPVASTLAILGSVDSLLTSLVADSLTKTHHKPSRELIGQGLGNIAAGLFGGVAGAGATMRTVVNIKSGGRSPLSGVTHSVLLLIVLLEAAPLAANIPMAVLAGILIKVGFDIIDVKFLKIISHAPKYDLAVMLLVFTLTVFDDLIFAVGAGIVLSSILFATSVSKQFNMKINEVPLCEEKTACDIEQASKYKIRVVDIEGILFFGSASRIFTPFDDLLETKYVIINCKSIPLMDISAVFALEDIIHRLHGKDMEVFLVLKNRKITKQFLRLRVLELIGRKNIFYDKNEAIEKAQSLVSLKINHDKNNT